MTRYWAADCDRFSIKAELDELAAPALHREASPRLDDEKIASAAVAELRAGEPGTFDHAHQLGPRDGRGEGDEAAVGGRLKLPPSTPYRHLPGGR